MNIKHCCENILREIQKQIFFFSILSCETFKSFRGNLSNDVEYQSWHWTFDLRSYFKGFVGKGKKSTMSEIVERFN